MAQLLAVALRCNLTRVFSFMLTAPATTHAFGHLGVPDGMHKTCHDGHWERVRAITEHQMSAFARILDAFEDSEEPTGDTLMDRACILGVSEYGEGWMAKAHLTVLRALGLEHESWGWNGGDTRDHLAGLI